MLSASRATTRPEARSSGSVRRGVWRGNDDRSVRAYAAWRCVLGRGSYSPRPGSCQPHVDGRVAGTWRHARSERASDAGPMLQARRPASLGTLRALHVSPCARHSAAREQLHKGGRENDSVLSLLVSHGSRLIHVRVPVPIELRPPQEPHHREQDLDAVGWRLGTESNREAVPIGAELADDLAERSLTIVRDYDWDRGRFYCSYGVPVGCRRIGASAPRGRPSPVEVLASTDVGSSNRARAVGGAQ